MSIHKATERYEAWLRSTLPMVVEADLDYKHQQMVAGEFPFLRATFYRWAERWPQVCPHLASAPVVLGVGDVHVENFGTWRDAEGRLVWGVNDFDEATHLPYTADLVRLATSAALAAAGHHLSSRPVDAADALLTGYQQGLRQGGEPFVLAERHHELRLLASGELRDPEHFWAKMRALPEATLDQYPGEAVRTVLAALPGVDPAAPPDAPPPVSTDAPPQAPPPVSTDAPPHAPTDARIASRRAGLGSLGRPRLVALARWRGAQVAREVKALLPAWDWALGRDEPAVLYPEVLRRAVRDEDPCTAIHNRWLVRRLAPDCARVELADLPAQGDETVLLHSMGSELANIHLGTPRAAPAILDDLAERSRRSPGWLVAAADRMVADTGSDWGAWRG